MHKWCPLLFFSVRQSSEMAYFPSHSGTTSPSTLGPSQYPSPFLPTFPWTTGETEVSDFNWLYKLMPGHSNRQNLNAHSILTSLCFQLLTHLLKHSLMSGALWCLSGPFPGNLEGDRQHPVVTTWRRAGLWSFGFTLLSPMGIPLCAVICSW